MVYALSSLIHPIFHVSSRKEDSNSWPINASFWWFSIDRTKLYPGHTAWSDACQPDWQSFFMLSQKSILASSAHIRSTSVVFVESPLESANTSTVAWRPSRGIFRLLRLHELTAAHKYHASSSGYRIREASSPDASLGGAGCETSPRLPAWPNRSGPTTRRLCAPSGGNLTEILRFSNRRHGTKLVKACFRCEWINQQCPCNCVSFQVSRRRLHSLLTVDCQRSCTGRHVQQFVRSKPVEAVQSGHSCSLFCSGCINCWSILQVHGGGHPYQT